jgi:multidrug efflux system membrane fusion protein
VAAEPNRPPAAGRALPWLIAGLLALGAGGSWWFHLQRATPGEAVAGASPAASAGSRPGGGRPGGPRFGGSNRVQPVSVGQVRLQDIRITVNAIGSIAAANTAVVKAKIEGELKRLHFKEGQVVKAGALLAELDDRALQITLAQAQGQFTRDQALLQNARLDLERFRDLLAKDAIARQQVDTQEAQVRQLQGTVMTDQAGVDSARLQLSYTRIVAPISGRVGLKQADLGNVVKPGDANGLLSIAQTQPVNLVFAVPDAHLPRLTEQLGAHHALRIEAWDREGQRRLAVGQLDSIDNAIDAATGTVKLKAAFANADAVLFPNQFVNVRLQLATVADALAVPVAALLRGADGAFVYRVGEDKTVSVRKVRAGASDGEWVAVQGDLAPGDTVVTDGVDRLRDGARVEVILPPAADDRPPEGGRRRRGGPRPDAASAPASGIAGEAIAAAPRTGGASSAGQPQRAAGAEPARRDGADTARRGAGGERPAALADAARPRGADEAGRRGDGSTRPERPADGPGGPGGQGEPGRPRGDFLSRLPPEIAEKVKAMSPDERRAFFEQRRAERARRDGGA